MLFKGDPTFEYLIKELPQSYFLKIVELRRRRWEAEPQLSSLM